MRRCGSADGLAESLRLPSLGLYSALGFASPRRRRGIASRLEVSKGREKPEAFHKAGGRAANPSDALGLLVRDAKANLTAAGLALYYLAVGLAAG
jgi:hypothetical protein